jgi:Tfp pilus assembly PilM family ATPase
LARYLALDWDQNQLHLIAANQRGATVQVQRASVWQEGQPPSLATAEELGKALRERLREAGIAAAPVLACVARDRVIIKEVRFPAVPETEEPNVVRFQTVKELTDAAEEVVIDYIVTGQEATGERKAAVLVVRRDVLQTYQAICQAAGLKLVGLTPRLIGISHCLRKVIGTTVVTPPPDPPDGTIAVVVAGEKTAEFCVLRGSTFLLTRSLPGTSNLAGEIRRNLAVHAGQSPQYKVCAVYVTGKGSGELRERLTDLIEAPVHTFDPFAGAETLDLPVGQRGAFAGAMGVLFARAEGDLLINFVSPREPKPPQNFNYRLARLAIVAAVALVIGLVVLGRVLHAAWSEDVDTLKAARQEVEAKLAQAQLNGKRLKALDDWDLPVTLDELYDLTARIPNVELVRVKSIQINPLPRKKDSPYVAKATIKGELRKGTGELREPLDKYLVPQFRRDGYYNVESVSVQSNIFIVVVNVERRPPEEYKYVVKDPTPAEEKAAAANRAKSRPKGFDFGFGKANGDKEGAAGGNGEEGKGRGKGKRRGGE